jgi:hypothetical protein
VIAPTGIQFGSGDWTTVVTNVTGTFTGEIELPDGIGYGVWTRMSGNIRTSSFIASPWAALP